MKISKPNTEGWLGKYDYNQFENYQIAEYNDALSYTKQKRNAIDLGANLGIMSIRMCKDFDYVHAFEPLFHTYLKDNVPAKNIKIYPYAVGEKEKKVTMRVGQYHCGGSNIIENKTGAYYEKDEIQVVTVDSFDIDNVDLIKIDVEKYEWYAIQGAKNTIEKYKPVLLIELHKTNPFYKEIFDYLGNLGYKNKKAGDLDYIFY